MVSLVYQVAPGKGVTDGDTIVVAPPVTQAPTMVGWPWSDDPGPQLTHWAWVGSNENGSNGQGSQGPSTRREGTANHQDQNSLQCSRCQGWGHMARECPTQVSALNQPGRNQGNVAQPSPVTATPANSRPLTFPPQPQTKANQHKGSPTNGPTRSCPSHSFF